MTEEATEDKHWAQYRQPKKTTINSNYKNILLGIVIGIIGTCSVFFLLGDVKIETNIEIGEQSADTN